MIYLVNYCLVEVGRISIECYDLVQLQLYDFSSFYVIKL